MKKITLLICIAFALFYSCKNDDDSTNENQSNFLLIGTWRVVQTFVGNGIESTDECDLMSTAEFMSNGRFEERFYVRFRENVDAVRECKVFSFIGDFSIDGDLLKQKSDKGSDDDYDRVIRFKIVEDTLKYITLDGITTVIFVKN